MISPYTRIGKVDDTFYSTVSTLRSIELLVGIKPLTQFDASAAGSGSNTGSSSGTSDN